MNYDRRNDGTYLITGGKHDNKNIVIKMGSIINEINLVEALTRETYNLQWILEENLEEELLTLKGVINDEEFLFDMNKTIVVNQFVKMVKENKTLEACPYISTLMQKSFETIYEHFLIQKGELLCSNVPMTAYVEIHSSGKTLGAASRFNFTTNGNLQLYEYTGKEIVSNNDLVACIMIENTEVKFQIRPTSNTVTLFNPSMNVLGYINMPSRVVGIYEKDSEIEIPDMALLFKVPATYSNQEDMERYITANNATGDITAYKLSLKPKARLININRFMLREFTI